MLNPVAAANTANTARWNQSMPKCHRYNGTAVSVRTNVPIKNELVVQLTRSIGMRKINAREFRGVVRRHLHSHSIADCKPNEPLAHLSGNVREHEMIVRERDAKHGPGQDHHDGALQFDRLFRIHDAYVFR